MFVEDKSKNKYLVNKKDLLDSIDQADNSEVNNPTISIENYNGKKLNLKLYDITIEQVSEEKLKPKTSILI